jgi:quinoprotein glucose dehydrogenase
LAIGAALLASAAFAQQDQVAPSDWPRYARDLSGTRYSPLDQIDTANVGGLDTAWTFRLRPEGGAGLLGAFSKTVLILPSLLN